ncbi:hypothetical protein NE237_004634 [Protea cynaroides]|uniref:Uncharacterized protein n=1 Tax=Protea cynaroides TaxID=273540 RepID=A0A9Q0QTS0_9MAGN|nr:hypothetical protein NE237_004634 [Protea cynaroides]
MGWWLSPEGEGRRRVAVAPGGGEVLGRRVGSLEGREVVPRGGGAGVALDWGGATPVGGPRQREALFVGILRPKEEALGGVLEGSWAGEPGGGGCALRVTRLEGDRQRRGAVEVEVGQRGSQVGGRRVVPKDGGG